MPVRTLDEGYPGLVMRAAAHGAILTAGLTCPGTGRFVALSGGWSGRSLRLILSLHGTNLYRECFSLVVIYDLNGLAETQQGSMVNA